eukprot:TRINITY_DN1121_c0_g1_i1.p1 TRINITY_DN1121_c0_g1~~TRINITY_DN1121_c0_g1_i1.p1  ORF type:complete len:506 (+),score=201.77 TRINITY_DN1121_c0_g1_i1:38-1555(+)
MGDEVAEVPPTEEVAAEGEATAPADGEAPAAEGDAQAADGEAVEGAPAGDTPEAAAEAPREGEAAPAADGEAADVEAVAAGDAAPPDGAAAEGAPAEEGAAEGEGEPAANPDAEAGDGAALPAKAADSAMAEGDDDDDSQKAEDKGDDDDEGMAELERQMEEEEEEEEVEEGPDPMIELQEKYDQLLELHERAMQNNVALQRRVIQRKVQAGGHEGGDKSQVSIWSHTLNWDDGLRSEGKVTEHKYQNMLHNVHSERLKLRLQQVKAARMSEELKNQLEAKRQKAIECRDSFQEFKRQVARHAEYARTGKKIQEKIIQEVEEFELDKDAEVEEVRGSNISLKNRLRKKEEELRKKDELAENLHVIDFEQLKIENQTLNEKIEERNEELHKLRKKTVVTVQIITHMREKVQFVQQEYQVLKAQLAQLDQELGAQRDLVTKTKHERDEHRQEYATLKQQTGIMNSEHLTKDFQERAEHIKELKDSISQLKQRHQQMTQFIKAHGGKI